MYALWHRVAIFRALEARGWRPLPPAPDAGYTIGERHDFVREGQSLRLEILTDRGAGLGAPAGDVAIATVRPAGGAAGAGGSAVHELALDPRESVVWRAAVHRWAGALSSRGEAPRRAG